MQTDTTTPYPDPQPLPRMTEADIAAAREKIARYLAESTHLGLSLTVRPITGQVMRLAGQIGLDLDALGRADDESQSDEAYFDHFTLAFWLLAAPIDRVSHVILGSLGHQTPQEEAAEFALRHLTSLPLERAALRAFIARWLEYRIEMAILQQAEA